MVETKYNVSQKLISVTHGFEHQLMSYWQNIKFYILIKIVISKYKWNFIDQLLLPYKYHGSGGMRGIFVFNFASCEPLSTTIRFHMIGLNRGKICFMWIASRKRTWKFTNVALIQSFAHLTFKVFHKPVTFNDLFFAFNKWQS